MQFPNRDPVFPEKQYEIEAILDHYNLRGHQEYLVYWLSYLNSDNS